MEAKLADFRARKRKEELLNSSKEFFHVMKENITNIMGKPEEVTFHTETSHVQDDDAISICSSNISGEFPCQTWSWYRILTYALYLVLWITVFFIAVHLQFGFVYGILSGLIFIYFNTRTGPRMDGEISAYSVFNPDFQSIDGTLKAEQFEREFGMIKYDPNSPKPEQR